MIVAGGRSASFRNALTTPLGRVFRNTGWLIAAKGVGAVLSLGYLAIAARTLGPALFGEFTLILAIAQALVGLVSFQMWRLVLRYGTPPYLAGDVLTVKSLVWRCARIDLLGGAVGSVLALPLTAWLAARFNWSPVVEREAWIFAAVMLLSARSAAVGALRLQDRFRDGAIASTSTPVFRFLGAVTTFVWNPTVAGFLLAWAAAEIATCVAYWIYVFTSGQHWAHAKTSETRVSQRSSDPGFWRFAVFTNVNSTLSTVGQQIALLSVGLASGSAAAGYFRLGYQLAQALLLISEMMSRSLYAEVESLVAKQSRHALDVLFARTTALACIVGVTVILIILILGRLVLHLIGGVAYLAAFPQLLLLGGAAGVQLIGTSFEPTLLALNRSGVLLGIRAVATIVLLLLLVFLLPHLGAIGGGVAVLGQSVVLVALLGTAARRVQRRVST
jgi:O-antigen/teichoic acid export membrane protein